MNTDRKRRLGVMRLVLTVGMVAVLAAPGLSSAGRGGDPSLATIVDEIVPVVRGDCHRLVSEKACENGFRLLTQLAGLPDGVLFHEYGHALKHAQKPIQRLLFGSGGIGVLPGDCHELVSEEACDNGYRALIQIAAVIAECHPLVSKEACQSGYRLLTQIAGLFANCDQRGECERE